MRLEGRRDGKLSLSISVEYIDELVLLRRRDETCATFGIATQVLAGNDSSDARFSKRLQVQAMESVLGRDILDDGDSARVARYDQIV